MASSEWLSGVVRTWHPEEGWGVLDSEATPGGTWAHFAVLSVVGFKELEPGQRVQFVVEAAEQDGFHWRATDVRLPAQDGDRVAPAGEQGASAYRSEVTIELD